MLQYLKILHMIDFLKSRDLTFFNKTHKVCKNSTKKGYKTNSSSYNRSLYGISLNKVLYFREIFLSCLDVRYSGLTVKLVFRSQTVINMFVRHHFFKSAPHCLNLWFVDGKSAHAMNTPSWKSNKESYPVVKLTLRISKQILNGQVKVNWMMFRPSTKTSQIMKQWWYSWPSFVLRTLHSVPRLTCPVWHNSLKCSISLHLVNWQQQKTEVI